MVLKVVVDKNKLIGDRVLFNVKEEIISGG